MEVITAGQADQLLTKGDWDNLWERWGGSMVNGVPREVPEITQCKKESSFKLAQLDEAS